MKKGGDSESTIITGPFKSVLVYAVHSLENVLGLARFRVFVPNMYVCMNIYVNISLGSEFANLRTLRMNLFNPIRFPHVSVLFSLKPQ